MGPFVSIALLFGLLSISAQAIPVRPSSPPPAAVDTDALREQSVSSVPKEKDPSAQVDTSSNENSQIALDRGTKSLSGGGSSQADPYKNAISKLQFGIDGPGPYEIAVYESRFAAGLPHFEQMFRSQRDNYGKAPGWEKDMAAYLTGNFHHPFTAL